MFLSVQNTVPPHLFSEYQKLFDDNGGLVAIIEKPGPEILTKEIFDKIPDGEVFKTIVTNLQTVHEPFKAKLKFLCKKGQGNDWAIYYGLANTQDYVIATHGDKVQSIKCIQEICPCDFRVLNLYRH